MFVFIAAALAVPHEKRELATLLCEEGIQNSGNIKKGMRVCCEKKCGDECGGEKCKARSREADVSDSGSCCKGAIVESQVICTTTKQTRCIMPEEEEE